MKFNPEVEKYRELSGIWGSSLGDDFGRFLIPGPCGRDLLVIASAGDETVPWEHVSVSLPNRCPNWPEMCHIKDLFWAEEEPVMQLHPPKSDYVNFHPNCLHLWKPLNAEIPLPPSIAVGPKAVSREPAQTAPL